VGAFKSLGLWSILSRSGAAGSADSKSFLVSSCGPRTGAVRVDAEAELIDPEECGELGGLGGLGGRVDG